MWYRFVQIVDKKNRLIECDFILLECNNLTAAKSFISLIVPNPTHFKTTYTREPDVKNVSMYCTDDDLTIRVWDSAALLELLNG